MSAVALRGAPSAKVGKICVEAQEIFEKFRTNNVVDCETANSWVDSVRKMIDGKCEVEEDVDSCLEKVKRLAKGLSSGEDSGKLLLSRAASNRDVR